MLIKPIKREFIPVEDKLIVIDPETGAWLCVNKECRRIIEYLLEAADLNDVYEKFPEEDPLEITELVRMVKYSEERSEETKRNEECEKCADYAPALCILKLTEACNLRCSYCYIDAGGKHNRMMSRETGLLIVKKFLEMHDADGHKSTITFHGGEPLLNFGLMRDIAEYLRPFRDKANLSIQTNATLITDEIAQFLKDNSISTGISFDGPKQYHDLTRTFPNGASSFELVMNGIDILKKHDVRFDVICVLNRYNASHIGELFDFFVSKKMKTFCLSPIQPNGRGRDEDGIWLTGDMLFDAYKVLLDRIIEHNSTYPKDERIYDRTLTYLTHIIYSNVRDYMCMRAPCGSARNILSFTVDGDLYGCDNFIGHEEFRIGSIYNGDIMEQVLGSPVREKSQSRSMSGLKRCRNCIWRGLCGGVCYSSDYCSGANGEKETEMCVFYKKMIPYLIKKMFDNPEIPYLLDEQLKKIRYRKLYIDIDRNSDELIDSETLEAILKLHEADEDTLVCLCVRELDNCPELAEMIGIIKEMKASAAVITAGSTSGDVSLCGKILEAEPMRIDFAIDEGQRVLETAEQFINARNSLNECKTVFGLCTSTASLCYDEELIGRIGNLLGRYDTAELIIGDDTDEEYARLNDVLDRMRELSMEGRVIIPDIDKERLSRENYVFLLGQSEDEFYHLWIDCDSFTGERLEKSPKRFFTVSVENEA